MSENTTPAPGASPLVLVVDDEEKIIDAITHALTLEGSFRVLKARGGREAQEWVERRGKEIQVALVDLIMPGMNGEEFLEWAKAVVPRMAVVIVSGNRIEDMVIRCLGKGAIDFLDKPFTPEQVCEAVERAITRQARINEKAGELHADRPATGWVELTAPSEMEYLRRMQRFTEVLFQSSLPEEVVEDLRMAIEEVGRNAIEWGNRFDRSKQFKISYCIFEDRVVLKFEDEGEGFRPDLDYDPTTDPMKHIKNRTAEGKRPGGFGLFLIQKLMDEVVYSEKGNVVLMTKFMGEE